MRAARERRGGRPRAPAAWALAVTLAAVSAWAAEEAPPPPTAPAWCPKAPPMPEPTGQVLRAATVDDLFRAARDVEPGGTILLADGHYLMPRYFDIHTDDVTLRGESGHRERVVLDGARSRHGELLGITGCSGVTVADLTVRNVKWNGIKINSDRITTRVTVRNCVIHNVWQRGVKGPRVRPEDRARFRPADCRIQWCLFTNDRPKQFGDDPADRADNFDGNYVGGIDVMYPRRWTISDNVFIGIRGRTGGARGAVFLWHEAEDCVVERNVIIDCDSGICLGNSHRPDDVPVHATRCIVRNNFLARCPEQGILADYTRDCRILHNTVHDPQSRLRRLIRLVHDNDGLVVAGNLLSGPPMRVETRSPMTIERNFVGDVAGWFVDAAAGNLHLKPGPMPESARIRRRDAAAADIDGQPRPSSTAVGADEPRPCIFPQPARVTVQQGTMALAADSRIVVDGAVQELGWAAGLLATELPHALGAGSRPLEIVNADGAANETAGPAICLGIIGKGSVAESRLGTAADRLSERGGAYVLSVRPEGAAILGRDARGVFYGCLTLLQLLEPSQGPPAHIACAEVVDQPYHAYRGMRATLPRGKPRPGEVTLPYYRNLLRLMAFCRLNHVWVQGCSWCVPMRRHPECAWSDVLTGDQAADIVAFASRHFLSMDGSLDWGWVYGKYRHLAELYPDETWETMKGVRRRSRVNVCPSNPDTWTMLLETMEDICEVLPGDHFAVPLDELYQEYHGSRWAVCPRCRDEDPVALYARFANRLIGHALDLGKTPIMSGGMLVREHQGWYKNIHKAIDRIEQRDKVVIYNWSEGHVRRGAMTVGGQRLVDPSFSATPHFRKHGYKNVMHLFAGDRWTGRPEMREVRGNLDCYGGFVSYYHPMTYDAMKANGTLARLAFTAQHLWSPDLPAMDSIEDRRACRYAEALAKAILQDGASYVTAIAAARKAYALPLDTGRDALPGGRAFESQDPPVNLFGDERDGRTGGRLHITLPVEEANPHAAYLILTLHDWDQEGEGEITLNGHPVVLKTSRVSNGRDHRFPPIPIPADWLHFGDEPNVVAFTYRATAGFIARQAALIVCDEPATP